MKMKKGLVWTLGVVGAVVVLTVVALVAQSSGLISPFASISRDEMPADYTKGDYYEGETKTSKAMEEKMVVQDQDKTASTTVAPEPAMPAGERGGDGFAKVKTELKDYVSLTRQMLNKNGNLTIESEDPMAASQKCSEVAIRFGGDILNSNTSYYGSSASVTMTLRVPVATFEKAINEIQKVGKVTSINTSAEDVTNEYIDLEASKKNKEKMIKLLNGLLDNARNEEAMIKMYETIGQYEQELETIVGQQKYLQGMTSYSRINLTITKPGETVAYPESNDFMDALGVIWKAFLTAMLWIMVVLVVGLPILGFILLIIWIVKLFTKQNKPQQQ